MGWAQPTWVWLPVFLFGCTGASPQSNYDLQALSVEYEGAGLPEFGTLNGTVTELGKKLSVIPRVKPVIQYLMLQLMDALTSSLMLCALVNNICEFYVHYHDLNFEIAIVFILVVKCILVQSSKKTKTVGILI